MNTKKNFNFEFKHLRNDRDDKDIKYIKKEKLMGISSIQISSQLKGI